MKKGEWRCDAEYKQERMHGETQWGYSRNDGQNDFQTTDGEGPGFLCGAS